MVMRGTELSYANVLSRIVEGALRADNPLVCIMNLYINVTLYGRLLSKSIISTTYNSTTSIDQCTSAVYNYIELQWELL